MKVGPKISLPAAVAEEKYSGKEASAADCSIPKKLPWNKRDFGEESLPYCESNDEYDAKDKKADDQSRAPSVGLNGVKVEWQEEEGDASRYEQETNNIELAGVVG